MGQAIRTVPANATADRDHFQVSSDMSGYISGRMLSINQITKRPSSGGFLPGGNMLAEKMQTVLLSGSLAHVRASTPDGNWGGFQRHFRLLQAVSGFEQHMLESASKGLRFAIFNDKQNLSEDDLKTYGARRNSNRPSNCRLKACWTIADDRWSGTDHCFFFVAPGAQAAFLGARWHDRRRRDPNAQPTSQGPGHPGHPNNRPSYSFNGAVNTSVQGNPVPLLYGRMIVGSAVISAGIYSEDQM
ncbi:tail assembly protein [Pseudomonas protegens]|uniref:tail assembly protein n=1 Tax=Pseudomonas protegens TaxID=380021 RepID=UPI0021AE8572|nr:tail assembly protein [Pseudomonas protegens]